MSPFLPSSAQHRITLHRRLLTTYLYLKEGSFWEAILTRREAWSITATTEIPAFVPDANGIVSGLAVTIPSEWPVQGPLHLLRPRYSTNDGLEVPSMIAAMVLPKEWGHNGLAWWRDLKSLHDWFVPDDCRSFDPMPEQTWAPFMSQCLVYDPPKDRLLVFADAAPTKVDFAPMPIGTTRIGLPNTAGPAMINAPIATLRNGDDVEEAYIEMYEELFHRLGAELREHGIDLFALRTQITKEDNSFFERHRDRLRGVRKEHFIVVRPETTLEDVRAAFQLLKKEMPARRATRKHSMTSKSDPLTCIQCAVWYRSGKTHRAIADHFGWSVQIDRTMNEWSESARAHIARGRQILNATPEERQRLLLGQD